MSTIKILQPPVIEVRPLTAQRQMFVSQDKTETKAGVSQTPDTGYRSLPPPQHAHEVVSNRLDTAAGKVKGLLEFTKYGALKIGKYEEGETGEIVITGDGITAININNKTTFNLDGRNGDATFAGELAAGGIITGKIDMGKDGYIIGGDQLTYRWILGKLP
jgi:hypothetical protein